MQELKTIFGSIQYIQLILPPEITVIEKGTTNFTKTFGLENNYYFVCLGTIEPRKNLSLVVLDLCAY